MTDEYFVEIKYSDEDLLKWVEICLNKGYAFMTVSHFDSPQFYVECRAIFMQAFASLKCQEVDKEEIYKRIEALTPFLACWMINNGTTHVLTVPDYPERDLH